MPSRSFLRNVLKRAVCESTLRNEGTTAVSRNAGAALTWPPSELTTTKVTAIGLVKRQRQECFFPLRALQVEGTQEKIVLSLVAFYLSIRGSLDCPSMQSARTGDAPTATAAVELWSTNPK